MTVLLTGLVARLEDFGLHVDRSACPDVDSGDDLNVKLSRGRTRQEFTLQLKRRATLSSLLPDAGAQTDSRPLLVGATSVSPRSADAFRRAGLSYVDLAGNAWIRFGDVLIDVRGRRPLAAESPRKAGNGGNLFSTGRAQVAFVLLQWPGLWTRAQRDVAEASGVSLGQAHNALTMFREAGFGPTGHRTYTELLDMWVASYPSGLARKLVLASYQGSVEGFGNGNFGKPGSMGDAVVSGEVAADHQRRPTALTLYVAELDPMLPVRNRWRSDGDTNITVRRKFWKTPQDERHDDDAPSAALRAAPEVLVYADLMASNDPRVRDAAPEWRQRIARREQRP